jgi:hypothetical protein
MGQIINNLVLLDFELSLSLSLELRLRLNQSIDRSIDILNIHERDTQREIDRKKDSLDKLDSTSLTFDIDFKIQCLIF